MIKQFLFVSFILVMALAQNTNPDFVQQLINEITTSQGGGSGFGQQPGGQTSQNSNQNPPPNSTQNPTQGSNQGSTGGSGNEQIPEDLECLACFRQYEAYFRQILCECSQNVGDCQETGVCRIQVPNVNIKANSTIAAVLRYVWQSLDKNTNLDAARSKQQIIQRKLRKVRAPEPIRRGFENQFATQTTSNIRRLDSVGNQYPNIDEGNLLAYSGNSLFIINQNTFSVFSVNGLTLTQTFTLSLFGEIGKNLIVANGFVVVITETSLSPPSTRVRILNNGPGGVIAPVAELEREGIYISSRQEGGNLYLIVQGDTIVDLAWYMPGIGDVYPTLHACASWVGTSNYVRNFATISLNFSPSFNFNTYLGCDAVMAANVAPSGNWYVSSAYFGQAAAGFVHTILQKVSTSNLAISQWGGLFNAYVFTPNRMDEQASCNLRVAGERLLTVPTNSALRLYSFNCFPFLITVDSGYMGPANNDVLAVRWVSNNVYVSFANRQTIRYQEGPFSFPPIGNIFTTSFVFSFYGYGGNNLIGLGYRSTDFDPTVTMFGTSGGFNFLMDYFIDPNAVPVAGSIAIIPAFESEHQLVTIDLPNQKILLPFKSNAGQPWRAGFVYIHAQTLPTCMIHPPINLCVPLGLPPNKQFDLTSRVYKHYDDNGGVWTNTPSEEAVRSVTLQFGSLRYLYTLSPCQLQVREHPSALNGNLPLQPSNFADLCP